jgi:hypothetical protein
MVVSFFKIRTYQKVTHVSCWRVTMIASMTTNLQPVEIKNVTSTMVMSRATRPVLRKYLPQRSFSQESQQFFEIPDDIADIVEVCINRSPLSIVAVEFG